MTKSEFLELVQTRIVFLDGATGSNLQKQGMPTGVCPELWMLENPTALIGLQSEFLFAGTDILLAPTFTANRIKLAEYGLEERIQEINKGLVGLSKQAIDHYHRESGNNRRVYIAADLTMTGEQLQPVGNMIFEELVDVYKEQLSYLLPIGVDLIIVETMMSLQECRAALLAIKETTDIPVIVSLTFQENSKTLYGTDPKTAVIVLQSMGADAVGVNCSTGPDQMIDIVREMKEYAYVPILAKPNAGIPMLVNDVTVFPMDAEEFSKEMISMVEAGANMVGGCCGSTPKHIELLVQKVKNMQPMLPKTSHTRALTTEQSTVEIPLEGNFKIVGERINPTGKKALQAELKEGKLDIVIQMAEEQAMLGAAILDINLGMNGIDEKEVMLMAIQEALRVSKLPLCIDSSHVEVIEAALRIYPGRALINSISLEREKFEKLLPIAKKYGAMFILLPLSDKGLPKDMEEKEQIIHTILERAFEIGLTKEDIIVDGLVNTVGANKNAALEALQTIRYCKEQLGIATIVGLSNISFGLPERQFINSTFLSFAIKAGLTMAIANPSQDLLMNTALAADLLNGLEDSAERYIERATLRPTTIQSGREGVRTEHFADGNQKKEEHGFENSKDHRKNVFEAVVKGNRKNIVSLVEKELELGTAPGVLIEQTLIPAITEVGRLYEKQIYFLPQLIAGAEAMKIAIDYLEPKLTKNEQSGNKGTIVIATVAGDIHDIGKNLVALMLKNYGFRVIDLGKDVASDHIIHIAKQENADIIALSALMTTTMVEMKKVITLAKEAGITAKIIIGGAVITDSYSFEIGADGYSPDAQSAVSLVKTIMSL
jgi:5-methyltetrahydrofolate--homocysteine methyltransferase